MRLLTPAIVLTMLLLLAQLAATATAGPQQRRGQRPPPPPPGVPQSQDDRDQRDALSDAVRRIERTSGGEVLSAERIPYDGRDVSRVKVVDDRGRVRVYMDDPQQPPPRRPPPARDDDD